MRHASSLCSPKSSSHRHSHSHTNTHTTDTDAPTPCPPHPLATLLQTPHSGTIHVERRQAGRLFLLAKAQQNSEIPRQRKQPGPSHAETRGGAKDARAVWLEQAPGGQESSIVARVPESLRAAALAAAAAAGDQAASVDVAEAEIEGVRRGVRAWEAWWEERAAGRVGGVESCGSIVVGAGAGSKTRSRAPSAGRRGRRRVSHPLPPTPSVQQPEADGKTHHPLPAIPRTKTSGAGRAEEPAARNGAVKVEDTSREDGKLRRLSSRTPTTTPWDFLRKADPSLPPCTRSEAFGPSDTQDTAIVLGVHDPVVVQLSGKVLADSVRYFAYALRAGSRFDIATEAGPRYALFLFVTSKGRLVVEAAAAWRGRAREITEGEDVAKTQALGYAFLELMRSVHDMEMQDMAHVHANMTLLDRQLKCSGAISSCLKRAEAQQATALACAVVVDAVNFLAFGRRFGSQFVFRQAFEAVARRARVSKDVGAYLADVPEGIRGEVEREVERMRRGRVWGEQWEIAWEKMG